MPADLHTVHTAAAPIPPDTASQAVLCGDVIHLSGQLGIDPASGAIPEDFAVQTRQTLKNVEAVLKAAGSSPTRVVSLDAFLIDMGRFAQFQALLAEAFGAHKPACTVVGVAALPHEAQVEIRCVAAVGRR